ncbi:MAG: cytochrome c [Planctomycetes bacterium]|nr:cytochrome c [Planctomycetota bacterium]
MKNMKNLAILCAVLCLAAITAAACGGDGDGKSNAPAKPKTILRKSVPAEFKGKKAPDGFDMTAKANIEAGDKLFHGEALCKTCHGEGGKGDGDAGKALDPKPTDLTSAEFQTGVEDDYIHWRIKTGNVGGPAGSGMTGFTAGTEEQIWQLLSYVRSLKGK